MLLSFGDERARQKILILSRVGILVDYCTKM